MREIDSGSVVYHISEEMFGECTSWEQDPAWIRRTLMESMGLYGTEESGNRFRLLHAHGGEINGNWVFVDLGLDHPVQEWVNKMDDGTHVLILAACNPLGLRLTSRNLFLFIP